MRRARSRPGALVLAALGSLSGVAAAGAAGVTVAESCPEYVQCALARSPLEWVRAAHRTIAFPRACQRTFTARLKDRFLMKPSALLQVDRTLSRLSNLDVRVECRAAAGIAYRNGSGPDGPDLVVAVGGDHHADRPDAPQELTSLGVALAMVAAVHSRVEATDWVAVPAPSPSPPSRLEDDDIQRAGGGRAADAPRLLLDTIAHFMEESWAESISDREVESLVIVGRLWDTETGRDCAGHKVLDNPRWTLGVNDQWIRDGVRARRIFYAGARVAAASLCRDRYEPGEQPPTDVPQCALACTGEKVPSVYQRELCMLQAAGYVRWGNYLVPPGWSRPPVCRE